MRDPSSPHSELSSPALVQSSYKADPANQEHLLNKYLHNGFPQSPQSELEEPSPYIAQSHVSHDDISSTNPLSPRVVIHLQFIPVQLYQINYSMRFPHHNLLRSKESIL